MNSEEKLYFNRQWLQKKYEEEGLCIREIAEICGCTSTPIHRKLVKFGIKRRVAARLKIGEGKTTYLLLPSYLHESLKRFSEKKSSPMAEIIRLSLFEYLKRNNHDPLKDNQCQTRQ